MENETRIVGLDEIFCPSCGQIIKKKAVICVKCGVPISGAIGSYRSKDKTVAILLAVFLSYWTWCYTYRKDAWKFWLNLTLSVLTLGIWNLLVAWIWAIIDVARRPEEFYVNFDQAVGDEVNPYAAPGTPPTDPEGLKIFHRNQLFSKLWTTKKQCFSLENPSVARRLVVPLLVSIVVSTFTVIPLIVGIGPLITNAEFPEFPGWYNALVSPMWVLGSAVCFVLLRLLLERQSKRKAAELRRQASVTSVEVEREFPEEFKIFRRNRLLSRLWTTNKQYFSLEHPSVARRLVVPLLVSIVVSLFVVIPALDSIGPLITNAESSDFPAWYNGLMFWMWVLGSAVCFVLIRLFLRGQSKRKLDELRQQAGATSEEIEREFPDVVKKLGGSNALRKFTI